MDEEGLKEKRRQKLNKGLYEARVRMKEEKAKEKAAAEEEARLEEQERENDFEAWSAKLRSDHEVSRSPSLSAPKSEGRS